MTPANFSNSDPQELVALVVTPGTPDVLSLLTTNIPQVHVRLTEMRQRNDHPQNHPREVWIDLSACQNFSEVRGDVLVRALRLTQFLPRGFIGTASEVDVMARAANLPRLDNRDGLPRVAMPAHAPSPRPATVPRLELDQSDDISADLRRRLASAQEENAATHKRADVLSQALQAVREQRDRFEVEVGELNTRVAAMTGQLEWAGVQSHAAEKEISRVLERLMLATSGQEEASARAQALEDGMNLVEQALIESRKEAWNLQNQLAEIEQGGVATAEQVDALSASLREVEARNAQLIIDMQSREDEFSVQRAEFAGANALLQDQVSQLQAALSSAHASLSNEQANTTALVHARDEVEKQAGLTSSMLEDALARLEELSTEVASANATVAQYRDQWQELTEDHSRAREALRVAQEEASNANLDVVHLNEQCQTQAAEIAVLRKNVSASESEMAGAKVRSEGLAAALEAARERADSAEGLLAESAARVEALSAQITQLSDAEVEREALVRALVAARDAALVSCDDLTVRLATQQAEVSRLAQDLDAARNEIVETQSALLDAAREVAQMQSVADEATRANLVLSELVKRNEEDLRGSLAEVEGLTQRLSRANDELSVAQETLDDRAEEIQAQRSSMEQQKGEFERRISLAKAETESLSRRLATAQQDAQLATAQLESVVEDLRASLTHHEELVEQGTAELAQARAKIQDMQSQAASAVAAKVQLEGQVRSLQGDLDKLRTQVRGLEGTIVEQEGQIQTLASNLDTQVATASQLREQVSLNETVIVRQQDQLEATRQSVAQGAVALSDEKQAHAATRVERDTARGEVESLTHTVHSQAETITRISSDLTASYATNEEQAKTIAFAEVHINEAQMAARADRKARAELEIELVNTQDALCQAKQVSAAPVMAGVQTTRHTDRVRSGQRVTALGDLVVTKAVSQCAELMAKGSIHIYGSMQGRAHAGCEGDTTARIYCRDFGAEQVAIAGRFVVLETIPPALLGRPVEVWLDEKTNSIQVRPLDIP